MEIDDDSKEFLISAVRARKIIYDASSVSNRNRYLKEQAWNEVAQDTEREVLWCKTEWVKLRDLYRKKKKAIVGKTGQARARIESWVYFNSLGFLDDYLVVASTSGNLESQASVSNSVVSNEIETVGADNTEAVDMDNVNTRDTGENCVTYSKKRHVSKSSPDPVDTEIVNFLRRPRDPNDEFYHFGMDIAAQLRKLNPVISSYVKFQIAKVMYECTQTVQVVNNEENWD